MNPLFGTRLPSAFEHERERLFVAGSRKWQRQNDAFTAGKLFLHNHPDFVAHSQYQRTLRELTPSAIEKIGFEMRDGAYALDVLFSTDCAENLLITNKLKTEVQKEMNPLFEQAIDLVTMLEAVKQSTVSCLVKACDDRSMGGAALDIINAPSMERIEKACLKARGVTLDECIQELWPAVFDNIFSVQAHVWTERVEKALVKAVRN